MIKSNFSASSFVTEVLNTAGPLEKDDINNKLSKITKRVDEVKVEVYEALQKKYDEFYPDLKTAIQLNDRVQALSTEMDNMAVKIEKEIKTKLQSSTSEFQELSGQLKEANARQAILEKLVAIHENLENIDKDLQKPDYVSAADRLDAIDARLKEPANEREREVKILTVLESQCLLQQEKLKQDINTEWSNHVHWTSTEDQESGDRTVTLHVDNSDQSRNVLKNVTQGLYNIDMLDVKLRAFGERLKTQVVQPAISREAVGIKIAQDNKSNELVLKYTTNKSDAPLSPSDVFERLKQVLTFLQSNVFCSEIKTSAEEETSIHAMTLLGDVIAADLQEELINHCLSPAVPSNQKDLDSFKEVISATETFHGNIVGMKLVDESDTKLTDFVNNINVLFANKKCQEILERARTLMTTELHNTIEVSQNHPFGELPSLDFGGAKKSKVNESLVLPANMKLSADLFNMPTYCISAHAQALMELAYNTLVEATESSAPCAIQLFYAIRNMFELYLSVVPTYHKEKLIDLPQLAALEHNNCMYLAHHLLTLGHQFKAKLPPPLNQGTANFIDLVPCLRRQGTECFLEQLSRQRDELLVILKQAEGFVNVSEKMYVTEKAIKQIMYKLEHLEKIWRPILPTNIYAKSIGTLLNTVIVEIITSVTSLEDISADDATNLHSLCSHITTRAPALYQSADCKEASGESSSAKNSPLLIHKYVRKWVKFGEIITLLNSNLQGISDRWADGKGPLSAECNATEVKQLIRALFQNTDRRAAVLARIK